MSSLWERVVADPRLSETVRAAVDGRADAVDLLWWAEHPGRPTPAGAADPAVAIERARRALYRAGGPEGDAAAVTAAAARHEEDLRRAVAAARAAVPDGSAASGGTEPHADPPAVPPAHRAADPEQDLRVVHDRPARPLVLAVLGAGVAFVVGLAIGALAFGGMDRAAPDRSAVPAFQVFDRPQRPGVDRPQEADAVPSFLEAGSVRRLRAYSTVGVVLYAARAVDDRVCVLVVVVGTPSPPACTTSGAFAQGGLSLVVRAAADPVDDSGRRPIDELDLTWNPDDTVSVTPFGVGAVTPSPAA